MKEEKSFWEKLKRWIDGDEVLLDADENPVVFIAVMLHVVMELPMFGDPNSITNNEVAARYLEKGIAETGAINFVAGMILDYRAFDTFGESNVLFMAVIAVLMLLQRDKKNIDAAEDQEMQEDEMLDAEDSKLILKKGAKCLAPVVILQISCQLQCRSAGCRGFQADSEKGREMPRSCGYPVWNLCCFKRTSFSRRRLFRWVYHRRRSDSVFRGIRT